MLGVEMFKVVHVQYGRCGYEGYTELGMIGIGGGKIKKDIAAWVSVYGGECGHKRNVTKGCDGSYVYSCEESNDVYYFVS